MFLVRMNKICDKLKKMNVLCIDVVEVHSLISNESIPICCHDSRKLLVLRLNRNEIFLQLSDLSMQLLRIYAWAGDMVQQI